LGVAVMGDERGQGLTEYVFIMLLVVACCIAALLMWPGPLRTRLDELVNVLNG